ncbi:MAG: SDR family oxidoreductase [Bryobacteraceae bacterium]
MNNRVVLITGGGTGIGRATGLLFASEGAAVVVNYNRSQDAAAEVVRDIEAAGGCASAMRADVGREEEVRGMMSQIESRFGGLDLLVNNAGWSQVIPHSRLEDLTDEVWDRTLNVNLRGAFYCARAAVPLLKKRPGASIVNIASAAAFHASGSSIIYAASKAAMVSMTKSLARALAPDIRVNAVCPGLLRTRFAGWTDEAFENAERATPIGRMVTVEEVAETALFLASGGTGLTGEAIVVDGGVCQLGRSR